MNYYDEEFITWLDREKITYKIINPKEHDELIFSIKRNFPFSGSKIEWSKIENPLNFNEKNKDNAFSKIAQKSIESAREIIFIGDSLTHFGYKIKNTDISLALAEIFEIPQHSYIFPQDLSWIACFSMEGDINIGESPSNTDKKP
ncbi:hypothetical protein [Pseudomonas sp. FEN]|uniref:hypothetical protein n=1 Tax=Pseudomonas sp. FEN TaxID=2767468 RepID=UPI001748A658|nr:hypothetical protein [Pseudomonas sp. FEN]